MVCAHAHRPVCAIDYPAAASKQHRRAGGGGGGPRHNSAARKHRDGILVCATSVLSTRPVPLLSACDARANSYIFISIETAERTSSKRNTAGYQYYHLDNNNYYYNCCCCSEDDEDKTTRQRRHDDDTTTAAAAAAAARKRPLHSFRVQFSRFFLQISIIVIHFYTHIHTLMHTHTLDYINIL